MENKQSKVWPPGFQSVLNPADCWDNFSVVSKHIIEAELPLLLNSQEELEAAEFAYRQHGWPALLAEAELFISGVVFRMWGSPLPDEFFATVEANPRPIMIASRKPQADASCIP